MRRLMMLLVRLLPNSVRTRLFYAFSLVFLCFIAILAIIINTMTHNIDRQITDNNERLSASVDDKISSYIKEIEYISSLFYLSEAGYYITDTLSTTPPSYTYSYAKSKVLNPFRLMKSVSRVSGNIEGIVFVDDSGKVYLSDNFILQLSPDDMVQTDLFRTTMDAYGRLCLFALPYDDWMTSITEEVTIHDQYICITRKLINTYGSQKLGLLMLLIPLDKFTELFDAIDLVSRDISLLIYDNTQHLVYATESGQIDPNRIAMESQVASLGTAFELQRFPILNTEWSCYVLTSIASTYRPLKIVLYSSLAYALFFIVVSVLITTEFSRSIRFSAREIVRFSSLVKQGRLDSRLGRAKLYEFDLVFEALNDMAARLRETIEKNLMLNLTAQKAEIKALQAQINPHFMYNTLNAINGCARTKRTNHLISMINALSDILRYSLGSANKLVTIAEELTHVDNYLMIQNIRFNNTIDYIREVDPSLMSLRIAPLLLQPIVENAINHGLRESVDRRSIRLLGYRHEGDIQIQISDNGVGIDLEKLHFLQQQLSQEAELLQSVENGDIGLGLLNVHMRIRIRYGNRYGLKIESEPNHGTQVCLTLPAGQTDSGEEAAR
jgi:two-component system sensor histidine kinase YesM